MGPRPQYLWIPHYTEPDKGKARTLILFLWVSGGGVEAKGGEENAEKENENQFAALKKQFEQ